jgi:hypothetical protein
MFVFCKQCEAVVDATVIADYDTIHHAESDELGPMKFTLLGCPKCCSPILVEQQGYADDCELEWDEPSILYPADEMRVNPDFPPAVHSAFNEALICFKAKGYTASVLMCRKTLESTCRQLGMAKKKLAECLDEMKAQNVIDDKFYEWAEALRLSGNEAAHDVAASVSRQDAKDIIDFANALLEYLFTFRDKFEKFMKRRQQKRQEMEK